METADISAQLATLTGNLKKFTDEASAKLEAQAATLEKRTAADKEFSSRLLGIEQTLAGPGPHGVHRGEISERAPLDLATGMPILGNSHRFADNLPESMRSQEPLDLNVMWRGILTNRWPSRDSPEKKALGEASGATGGYTLPLEIAATYIDFARAASVCIRAGAQTLPMTNATLRVPVLASDPVSTWKQENQPLADTSITLDKRDAAAKLLMSWLYMSIELAEDSPMIAQIVSNAFARSMAQQLDAAALVGQATYGPQGLLYNPLVHETAGAGTLDFDDISKAVDLIRYRNHEPNAYVCDPGGAGQLDRLKASTAGSYLGPSRTTAQLTQLVTSAAAGNCFVGDWSQLWFFPRTSINIEVSREAGTAFANAQIAVRAYLRADAIAVAPAAFEVLPGLSS